jgi:uroporphyrinogen-III synthase
VFFTSKNSVNAFFNQEKLDVTRKYAALGSATAQALKTFTNTIHFIGEGETTEVAQQFLTQLKPDEKVVFPVSNVSLQTVQKSLPKESVVTVEAYLTEENFTEKIEADTYVFTSPSNVRSFLKHNSIPSNAKTIAVGNATTQHLKQCGISKVFTSWSYSELGLVDCV